MSARRAESAARLTDALWSRYRDDGDVEARAQLLDGYLGLVHHTARELLKTVSQDLELDELVSAGTLGLVQAIEGFELARGLAFSTYAVPRIRGAMLDELRSRDWIPRSIRTRRRLLARTSAVLQHQLGRAAEPHEMAAALGVDLPTYWRWTGEADPRVMLALHHAATREGEEHRLEETIPDPASREPFEALTQAETLAELRDAFADLPHKERLVLTLYYYEELSLRQIGEVLHVTESRVSQIRQRALQRLRVQVHHEREDSR